MTTNSGAMLSLVTLMVIVHVTGSDVAIRATPDPVAHLTTVTNQLSSTVNQLNSKLTALKADLASKTTQINSLTTQIKTGGAQIYKLNHTLNQKTNQLNALDSWCKGQINGLTNRVGVLETPIAFSARFQNDTIHSIPVGRWQNLIFDVTLYQTGGENYNKTTGLFIAPSTGTYVFFLTSHGGGRGGDEGGTDETEDEGSTSGTEDEGSTSGTEDEGSTDGTEDEGSTSGTEDEGGIDETEDEGGTSGIEDEGDTSRTEDEGGIDETEDEGGIDETEDEGGIDETEDEGGTSGRESEGGTIRTEGEGEDDRGEGEVCSSKVEGRGSGGRLVQLEAGCARDGGDVQHDRIAQCGAYNTAPTCVCIQRNDPDQDDCLEANIIRNTKGILATATACPSGYSASSNMATTLLRAGDRAYVRTSHSERVFGYVHTTFSGFKLTTH